jgi:hypothetical protein
VVLKRVKRENVVAGQERKEKSRLEKKRSSFFARLGRAEPKLSSALEAAGVAVVVSGATEPWGGKPPPGNRVEPPRRVEGVRCR